MFSFLSLCFCWFKSIKYWWISFGSDVEFLSGNTLLSTLIITFSLASKRNLKFFRKVFFLIGFWLLFTLHNSLNNFLCSLSASSINKNSVRIFLKNMIGDGERGVNFFWGEGVNFFWEEGGQLNPYPLHISRRTNLISI